MWTKQNVVGAAVLGLVVAACADSPMPTAAVRATDARAGWRDPASAFGAEVPLAYYELSLEFAKRTAGFTPPVQARAYGYMGLALYEAVVGGMSDHASIASQLHGIGPLPSPRGAPYHWPLVANGALAEVMRGLWGGATSRAAQNVAELDALEARIAARYDDVPPGLADLSIEFGRAVGAAVFATSRDDGGHEGYRTNTPAYTPPSGPGLWVPTAAGQAAIQPYWGRTVRTFVLARASECDQGGPPPYSEQPGSAFYQEAAEVYEMVRSATPEQITIARFWADGPGTISGPGHSLAIASQILVQQRADLAVAAETYARVGLATADAVTALWWAKYHYNVVRPVTYIQRVIDPAWTTRLPTPGFPEYPSAHSAQSAAATTALEYVFGPDVAFVDHAHDADGFAPRAFARIYAAAEEAGDSRMYAGIHFRSGNVEGRDLGRCVAARVHGLRWHR